MSSVDARRESHSSEDKDICFNKIAKSLSHEDIIKMSFLFKDLLKNDEFKAMTSEGQSNALKLRFLIKTVLAHKRLNPNLSFDVLVELLFLTKNYRHLKELGTCKHIMKESSLKKGAVLFTSDFRRFLLSLCDDLIDEDVNYIWNRVNRNNSTYLPKYPEFLFEWMLNEKIIAAENVEDLSIHFQVLERQDLLDKVNAYNEKIGLSSSIQQYDLDPVNVDSPCGLAYIFNHSTFIKIPDAKDESIAIKELRERKGTDIDATKLVKLWKWFGLETRRMDNLKKSEVESALLNLKKMDLSSYKIIVICILTHGDQGVVYCSDRAPLPIAYIENILGTATSLANKPKLLFIQACQGNSVQHTSYSKNSGLATTYRLDSPELDAPQESVPQYSDILVGMATVPGFSSIRSTTEGTHYIQSLSEVLLESGDKEDLTMLMTDINWRVVQKRASMSIRGEDLKLVQMPTYRSQLTKRLRFKKAPLNRKNKF